MFVVTLLYLHSIFPVFFPVYCPPKFLLTYSSNTICDYLQAYLVIQRSQTVVCDAIKVVGAICICIHTLSANVLKPVMAMMHATLFTMVEKTVCWSNLPPETA